jgi:chromosome segregation ATPase
MKKLIAMLVGATVLYFAINGVLAVIQESSQRSNQEAYATLEAAVAAKRDALSALNEQLDIVTQDMDRLQPQIDDLDNQITAIEKKYKNGDMPSDEVRRHNAIVAQHNALVTELNADLHKSQELETQIRASVDAYNHDIESANTLAKQGMTRSLLMPGLAQ